MNNLNIHCMYFFRQNCQTVLAKLFIAIILKSPKGLSKTHKEILCTPIKYVRGLQYLSTKFLSSHRVQHLLSAWLRFGGRGKQQGKTLLETYKTQTNPTSFFYHLI